jgi:5-hydroxyisourate hydrolase-like protein (transthyretin family)
VQLTSRGEPLSNRIITIYQLIDTRRQRLADVSTSKDGTVTLPLANAESGMTLIAEFVGDQEFQASETSISVK